MTKSEIAQVARDVADWVENEAPEEYDGGWWSWLDSDGNRHG